MFSLMGNCLSSVRGRRKPKKSITLTLMGLDNAGKTTASYSFSGETIDLDAAPTVGFRSVKFTFERHDITLYDIGGGKTIRGVWKQYFPDVHGVIFVVDSSTPDRSEEAKEIFRDSLGHPNISGKPVLLLANKQDKPDALDEVDICEMLNLESVVNSNKCPCRIDACSAVKGSGRKMDTGMREGLKWLLSTIDHEWPQLQERVEADMKVAQEAKKAAAAERKERVRRQREEREKKEEEERQKLGIEKKASDDEDMVDGDPFKPLDLDELKKKDAQLKAEKKRLKELKAGLNKDHNSSSQGPQLLKAPSSSRSAKGDNIKDTELTSLEGERTPIDDREEDGRVFSPRSRPTALPPLTNSPVMLVEERGVDAQKRKKKKRSARSYEPTAGSSDAIPRLHKASREITDDNDDNDNDDDRTPRLPKVKERPRRTNDVNDDDDDDTIVLATPRSQAVLTESHSSEGSRFAHSTTTLSNIRVSTHDDFPSRQMLAQGISRVPRSLDGGEGVERGEGDGGDTPRTRKVKKKRLRQLGMRQNHNGGGKMNGGAVELTPRPQSLLASLDGGDLSDDKKKSRRSELEPTVEESGELSARGQPLRESNNNVTVEKRPVKLSRNSQMHSNISIESDRGSRGSRSWGLAEDLPAVADDVITRRQPNVIDDSDLLL